MSSKIQDQSALVEPVPRAYVKRGHSAAITGMLSGRLTLFLASLGALNLVWEVAQLPLYALWQEGSWEEIAFAVAHCTAGDVLIALFCTIAALIATGWHWPRSRREQLVFLSAFVFLAATYTIFSEWFNTAIRLSWTYSDLMPVLPLLGTGLSPLLQWILLPILAFWLASRRVIGHS